MSFTRPELLALLVVPLVLAYFILRRQGVAISAPVAGGTATSRRMLRTVLALPGLLPPVILAIFVVLSANPVRYEQSVARVPKQTTNIQFCLDVSNSMLATRIGRHCRYCAATGAIGEFAKGREGDAFGLTLFGTIPIIWLPLTDDVSALYRAARLCYPDYMPKMLNDHADISNGVRASVEQLATRANPKGKERQSTGSRLLILLTDGEDAGLVKNEAELTSLLQREDITLFVIVFQRDGTSAALRKLAMNSHGGQYFDCSTTQELDEVFRHIDSMKKIEYEVSKPTAEPDTRPWLLGAAAAALCYVLSLFYLRFTPW